MSVGFPLLSFHIPDILCSLHSDSSLLDLLSLRRDRFAVRRMVCDSFDWTSAFPPEFQGNVHRTHSTHSLSFLTRERHSFLNDVVKWRRATQRHKCITQNAQKHKCVPATIPIGSETDSCTRNPSSCKPTYSVSSILCGNSHFGSSVDEVGDHIDFEDVLATGARLLPTGHCMSRCGRPRCVHPPLFGCALSVGTLCAERFQSTNAAMGLTIFIVSAWHTHLTAICY